MNKTSLHVLKVNFIELAKENLMNEQVKRTVENLKKNNFDVLFFSSGKDAVEKIIEMLKPATSISRGGSATIDSLGLIERIEKEGLPFADYKTREQRLASITAEYYLASTNAITEDGKLVNVDGSGNRVAAMSFGPKKVFIVSGVNKIVADESAAIERIRNVAAPMNAKRLSRKTPCVKTGKCSDCSSEDRICRKTHMMTKPEKDRVSIFLIDEQLGF